MKSFACGDVVPGCDARFLGRTDADILSQVGSHASEAHGLHQVPSDVADAVRRHIHETA